MAKKQNKAVKEETLETILFNCRNSLRGRAAMTDKRDLLLTLVFLKFIGERFKQQKEKIRHEIVINDEELVTISRMFGYPGIDLQDKCWILLAKYNLKMLILTCGINGSYVFTPGVVSFQETPKVPVADTVGAGDSFTAAFCASILNGKPVPEAHKLAVEVSAYVCTQRGAMPELPQVLKDRLM